MGVFIIIDEVINSGSSSWIGRQDGPEVYPDELGNIGS